jgi:hypothetical protein
MLSSVPWDYLFSSIAGSLVVLRYFRLFRLLKMYRLFEIASLIRQHTSISVPLFRIGVMFVAFVVIAHWFNCVLLLAGLWELDQHRRFDGKTLLRWLINSSAGDMPPPELWTPWQLYFNMLILAVCFMGSIMYGDIIPFTLSEEILSILFMIIGRGFISFLFAEVSSYVQQQYAAFDNHTYQEGVVVNWTKIHGVSPDLKKRFKNYFDYKWHNHKGIEDEKLIEELPPSLRKEVKNFIYQELIRNCEVFPRENLGALSTITDKLKKKFVPSGEFIIR